MAKNKNDPFAELATDEPQAPVDETATLKARIAELEARLSDQPHAAPLPTGGGNLVAGIAPDINPTFSVSVKDGPKDIRVHAADEANAVERMRHKTGMIRTECPVDVRPIAS